MSHPILYDHDPETSSALIQINEQFIEVVYLRSEAGIGLMSIKDIETNKQPNGVIYDICVKFLNDKL